MYSRDPEIERSEYDVESHVTARELVRRLSQVMPVVLLVGAAIGYGAGIEARVVLLIEVLFLTFAGIVTIQFIRRGYKQEDLSGERLVFYFMVVPVVMAGVSLTYVWLRLPPWLGVAAFPFAVLGLNGLYSMWTQHRSGDE